MSLRGSKKRLHRGEDGKILGGVTTGLADYFDIDPVIFRIGFVALAFMNGLGVLLYVISWIILPSGKRGIGDVKVYEHATAEESTTTE